MKEYKDPEDIFKEDWFKDLSWYSRLKYRFIIALIQTINYI